MRPSKTILSIIARSCKTRQQWAYQMLGDQRGFSLVEVIFASVIGVIIMGMLMILYIGANRSMVVGITSAEINADGRLAMDHVVRDVRWGTQVMTSHTHSVSSEIFTTDNNELIVEIPSIDSSGDVIASTYDYVIFTLNASNPTRLRKVVDPDASSNRNSIDQTIANNINSFNLTSSGTDLESIGSLNSVESLEIVLTVNKQPLNYSTITETLNSVVKLRNHN